jgi:hypothetical protein
VAQDIFGSETSLGPGRALEAWNATQRAFLAHDARTPEHLGAVLREAPEFAKAHAIKGLFLVLLGRRALLTDATAAHDLARALARDAGATRRERRYIAALGHYLAGYPARAIAEMEAVLDTHPQDALAMKLSHAIRFVLGDAAGMLASVERVLPSYDVSHPARGYAMGCLSFALEETGAYSHAIIAGHGALALAPDDAWGLHAVTHVHDMTAQSRKGLGWLDAHENAWAHCNNFRFHVWWHKALLHLDLREVETVFDLYDHKIRSEKTDDYRDISNATSLLMRLELEGVCVGDRWDELADLAETHTDDGSLVFADLHYLMPLLQTGRRAASVALADTAQARASDAGDIARGYATPGCAAISGLCAFAEGDHRTAFDGLLTAWPHMSRAGGSHAQRDVFERITIDAGIRAGQIDDAERVLRARTNRRGGAEDTYASARFAMIAAARGAAAQPPAA